MSQLNVTPVLKVHFWFEPSQGLFLTLRVHFTKRESFSFGLLGTGVAKGEAN
jgi:hypothetical protein